MRILLIFQIVTNWSSQPPEQIEIVEVKTIITASFERLQHASYETLSHAFSLSPGQQVKLNVRGVGSTKTLWDYHFGRVVEPVRYFLGVSGLGCGVGKGH